MTVAKTRKEILAEYWPKYYAAHKEKIAEHRKEVYKKNRDKILARNKQWFKDNKNKWNEYQRAYKAKKKLDKQKDV